jgi:nitrate reductase NapD
MTTTQALSPYHVCGVLLMSRAERVPAVEQALRGLAGVELHASAGGRLVVTLEGPSYGYCADRLAELATLPGVASASLIYHQVDNESPQEEAAA